MHRPLPEHLRLDPDDLAAALSAVPAAAGVAQILGADEHPLVTARPASLRRWALTQLGPRKPPVPGRRPPTDLRPLARALRYARASSSFHQRLVYERWLAPLVPLSQRRDLRPPAYLHLDLAARFPRVSVSTRTTPSAALFGPFRDRRAAERALKPLHKLFALRPCEYAFEPDPAWPTGLACLYAQVRTCAAPCLGRVSEDDYRALARRAAEFLGDPERRPDEVQAWLPRSVAAADAPALVVERARGGFEVYPVWAGAVLDDHARCCGAEELVECAQALAAHLREIWSRASEAPPVDDRAWLAAHLHARSASTAYISVPAACAPAELAERLQRASRDL